MAVDVLITQRRQCLIHISRLIRGVTVVIVHDRPRCILSIARAVRELREAILVVNTRRGDDGQVIGCRVTLTADFSASVRHSDSVRTINRLVQNVINAEIIICSDSPIEAVANRNAFDVRLTQLLTNICLCDVQRQTEVDHESLFRIELVIQINNFVAGLLDRVGKNVVAETVLCADLGHFLQLPVDCLRYTFYVHNSVVAQASVLVRTSRNIGELITESRSAFNRNIVAIERQRCIVLIEVVDCKGILGNLGADIDADQFATAIRSILQLINLWNSTHGLIPNRRFSRIVIGRSKCAIATISRRGPIRHSYFPNFIVAILREANSAKDSRFGL